MRIRTIKPEFFEDEHLAALAPHDRLLFIGLWCLADKNGVLEDRPAWIKARVFPYEHGETTDVSRMLPRLVSGGFVVRYAIEGRPLIWIRSFARHQRITGKEAEGDGRYPMPPSDLQEVNHKGNNGETPGKHPGAQEQGTGNREREQGTGNGGAPEGATRSTARFVEPSLEEVKLAMAKAGLPEDQAQAFINYHAARGWMLGKSKMKSWPHAVGTWAQNYRTGFNRNGNHHRSVAEERNSFIGQPGCEGDEADVPFV